MKNSNLDIAHFSAKNSLQNLILNLQIFWAKNHCTILPGYDMEVGAGTFHPATFLRALGPEPWNVAFVQASRRPTDGRFGDNPNRLQHYFQFQVMLKPAPKDIQDLYLSSLKELNIDMKKHDIRFVEDNWESPTLGASGVGWEVWIDGMEVSQFTYFQQMGGSYCTPISGELTYGLERLAMYLQNVDNLFDLRFSNTLTYGDIFYQNEVEQSHYNFEFADIKSLFSQFDDAEKISAHLIKNKLTYPAYEQILKASHLFNLLDARKAISATDRARFILRIRDMSQKVAECYLKAREELGFPLLKSPC